MAGSMKRPHNRTGRQRWYVTFQNPVITYSNDGNGTPTTTYVNTQSVWAEIAQMSGQEVAWPQQVQAEEMFVITCRWFSNIAQAQRVTFGTRIFNIVAVKDIISLHHVVEVTVCEVDPEE